MLARSSRLAAAIGLAWMVAGGPVSAVPAAQTSEPRISGASPSAVTLGRDLDGDGDSDEVEIRLEVIEVREEVYPGKFVTFWVFAPEGQGMTPVARVPSPTIRVEQGDRVRIVLQNTHYLPHTIHLHGTVPPNPMDTRPPKRVNPGEAHTFTFIATEPGTHYYHCHVVPDVHPLMGLAGMLIIEPNRARNRFSHLVPGAGRIRDLAAAAGEDHRREYSLVYMDVDERLNRIPQTEADPREIDKRLLRQSDPTRRRPDIRLLNGRSFPSTLRDTPIEVKSGEPTRLRVLNAGSRTVNLHTHGHRPEVTRYGDDFDRAVTSPATGKVVAVDPNRRVDLDIRPGSDGFHASGAGVWTLHDHPGPDITDGNIGPGGDVAAIVYEGFMGDDGLPRVPVDLGRLFDRDHEIGEDALADGEVLDTHRFIVRSCDKPRGFRRIHMKAGARFARKGEAFAFEPRVIRAEPCEEVEIVVENTDAVRHAFMLPGLNPMFMLEFTGPQTRSLRFVTPDKDVTLDFHCHVEIHEKMGMLGQLIVGKGGNKEAEPGTAGTTAAKRFHEGIGVVVAIEPRNGRMVVDHEEIKDFMAPMVMSYAVSPATLLRGLKPKDKVRFTIDADKRVIVDIKALGK